MRSAQKHTQSSNRESIQYGTPAQREIIKERRVQKKRVALFQRLVLFAIISICSIGFLTVQLINQELAISKKVDQKEQLEQQKQELKEEKKDLKQEVKNLNDKEYIGEIARRDLYLSKPNETLFKVQEDNTSGQ